MKRAIWVVCAVFFCGGLLWVFGNAFGKDVREVPKGIEGKPAPEFTMKDLVTGKTVTLAELKGKPTLMNFWASWCYSCTLEHPVLVEAARRHGKDINFVGVVFEDSEPNATGFLTANGANYPQLFDERGQISVEYGLSGVPETYFIDPNGKILYKHANAFPRVQPTRDNPHGLINPQLESLIADLKAKAAATGTVPTRTVTP